MGGRSRGNDSTGLGKKRQELPGSEGSQEQ